MFLLALVGLHLGVPLLLAACTSEGGAGLSEPTHWVAGRAWRRGGCGEGGFRVGEESLPFLPSVCSVVLAPGLCRQSEGSGPAF